MWSNSSGPPECMYVKVATKGPKISLKTMFESPIKWQKTQCWRRKYLPLYAYQYIPLGRMLHKIRNLFFKEFSTYYIVRHLTLLFHGFHILNLTTPLIPSYHFTLSWTKGPLVLTSSFFPLLSSHILSPSNLKKEENIILFSVKVQHMCYVNPTWICI